MELYWNTPDDIVALTNVGTEGLPALIPDGVADLARTEMPLAQGVMMTLRDESGKVVGLGTELEVYPDPSNSDAPLEVYLTIMLPGRGTLFVHETKNYADPALTELFTKVAESGVGWEGELPVVSTVGPGPAGKGVILSGTGEFEGATGEQSQTMNFRRIPTDSFPVVENTETLTITRR